MGAVFGAMIWLGLALIVLAGIVLFAIGFRVVKKYPDRNDPDRNARRYTYPAAAMLSFIIAGGVAGLIGGVGLIVSGLWL